MRASLLAGAMAAVLFSPLAATAAPTTYSDQATFLAALGGSTTYDFETSSGFPASGGNIGLFDSINFDAQTYADGQATSGAQTMTGSTGTFGTATLTFAPGTTGIGLYALDLTTDEVVRLSVNFASGPAQVYDIGLGGQAAFSPIYFGVLDNSNTILTATVLGTDVAGANRAWMIDDLSVSAVPEPSAWALFGLGLMGLAFANRFRKA